MLQKANPSPTCTTHPIHLNSYVSNSKRMSGLLYPSFWQNFLDPMPRRITQVESGIIPEDETDCLKRLFLEQISAVQSAGRFAASSTFVNFPSPGICVDRIGKIPIPLSHHDASLIGMIDPTTFRIGNLTLVAEEGSKTWEVDASKVSFANEAWHGWVNAVARRAAKDLGVTGDPDSISVELYKMVLSVQGGKFQPHTAYVYIHHRSTSRR